MATSTETVLIDFQADFSSIESATDALAKAGVIDQQLANSFKATNAQISKQSELLRKDAQEAKGLQNTLTGLDKTSKTLIQNLIQGFGQGVDDALNEAGVSLEELETHLENLVKDGKVSAETIAKLTAENKRLAAELDKVKKGHEGVGGAADSARARLKAMREEMLDLADAGQENSDRFRQLQKEAGELADNIGDVQARINATSSDTATFDGLLSAAQGVTGAFAAAQGAAALFGDESEETQKILLKVNASMAILQGLQQVQAVLQKESAASLLLVNTQRKIEVIQTQLQTAAESKNIVVRYGAIAAQKILNAVMSANPIGLLISALGVLATALVYFTSNAKEAAIAQGQLNAAIDSADKLLKVEVKTFQDANKKITSDLKLREAQESEILKAGIETKKLIITATEKEIANLRKTIAANQAGDTKAANEKLLELEEGLKDQKLDLYVEENEFLKANRAEQFADQKKRADEAEALEKEKADKKKAREEENKRLAAEALALEQDRLSQNIAGFKLEQLGLQETSNEWKNLQKSINDTEAELALLTESGKKAQLILAETAIENAKLFTTITQSVADTAKSDADIAAQFAEEGAKETARIQKETNDAKQKELFSFMAARTKVIVDADKNDQDKQKEKYDKFVKGVQEKAQLISNIYSQISQAIQAITAEQDKALEVELANKKKAIEEELEAGQITEKEAINRGKRIEQEEKKLKTQQAQRNKQLAVFQAIIGTAQAVIQALASAPPPYSFILAGIVAALGAAQVAAIASRPIPKFAKGKSKGDNYEGPGIVGEAGAELIVRDDGRMHVAKKPELTWLGKKDQVFTSLQTQKILQPTTQINEERITESRELNIDYDRLAKTITKHLPGGTSININKDFIEESVSNGLTKAKYFDKYYSYKNK